VTAAERGHSVILLESDDDVGGQLRMAEQVPGKSEFSELLRYFRTRISTLGIDVRLGTRATPGLVASLACDEVVVATGVVPRVPDIEGLDHPMVMTYVDALRRHTDVGRRVAIIGAGGVGFDVAEFLVGDPRESLEEGRFRHAWEAADTRGGPGSPPAAPRHEVTLLQRSATRVGASLGRSTGWIHRRSLARAGVRMLAGVKYLRIDDDGLHVEEAGGPRRVAADSVIVCAGQESLREIVGGLEAVGIGARLIGGALVAGEVDCARAIEEGTALAGRL
jgi:2,4-dienoyl-CoA reductase (NADPH2)